MGKEEKNWYILLATGILGNLQYYNIYNNVPAQLNLIVVDKINKI